MRAVKASKWKCNVFPALATKTSSIPPFSPSSDFEPSSGHDTEELHAFLDMGTNLSPSKKTHIKDIEDEDNVAGLLEHYIEDFPWPASDLSMENYLHFLNFFGVRRLRIMRRCGHLSVPETSGSLLDG